MTYDDLDDLKSEMDDETLARIGGGWKLPKNMEKRLRCRICSKEMILGERAAHQKETGHIFFEKIGNW